MSENKPTPSKLSSNYKKHIKELKQNSPRNTPKKNEVNEAEIIEISDDEPEAEQNQFDVTRASTLTSITRRQPRRDSTILAGNLTVPDSGSDSDENTGFLTKKFSTQHKEKKKIHATSKGREIGVGTEHNFARPRHVTNLNEITEEIDQDFITEDETDFYSCDDEGVNDKKVDKNSSNSTSQSTRNPDSTLKSNCGQSKPSSLDLVLSETNESSLHRYHATPGIVLQHTKKAENLGTPSKRNDKQNNIFIDSDKTPTNSPARGKKTRKHCEKGFTSAVKQTSGIK
jgi:hypothetical protein